MAPALLQKVLRTPYWFFYAALSVFFLALGTWAGIATAAWVPVKGIAAEKQSGGTGQAADLPANGQRNLLVLGVDSLDGDDPRLESLWLVLYFPGRSPATLMPLFPGTGASVNSPETSLAAAFSLDPSGDPSPEFFEQLRHEQVWWNGFVLMDETALAALLDGLGGVDLDGEHVTGLQALEIVEAAREDQGGSLPAQVRLLQAACSQAGSRISGWEETASLAGTLGSHLRTDLEILGLVQEWLEAAGAVPTLECEFPLLQAP